MGESVIAWQRVADVWANVVPQSARETSEGAQIQPTTSHVVYMRYREDVKPDWRIEFKGRTLAIVGVMDIEEREKELRIAANEQSHV
jgi:SPP1 family predicted phage head-tail adaptor